jgi:hypothetical protein
MLKKKQQELLIIRHLAFAFLFSTSDIYFRREYAEEARTE